MHAETYSTIKTSRHSSLEKYTSHFIWKGYERYYLWEVSWRLNRTATYWPPPRQLYWLQQHFFPVLLGCSTRGLGAPPLLGYGSHSSIFSPTDLNFLSLRLYNNLTSTYFLWASHLYSIQPVDSQGYPLISSTGCTCNLHRCISSFDSLAGVNMLQNQLTT